MLPIAVRLVATDNTSQDVPKAGIGSVSPAGTVKSVLTGGDVAGGVTLGHPTVETPGTQPGPPDTVHAALTAATMQTTSMAMSRRIIRVVLMT